jgi:glycosyltransferase involved in cell wall biosynthesis
MITFPDMRKNSNLYTDLVEEFNNNGHNVYVAALLEKKNNKNTFTEKINGITVLRVKCGDIFNVNLVRKGITTISLPYKFKQAINKYFNNTKFNLIIYPTPPITFAPVVKYIKKRDKCKSYLILRDIFPQNARDLGLMNNNLLFNYFRKKEQQLYDLSDYIGCMSRGNIKYVSEHNNIDEGKLEILYNWKKIGYDTNNDAVDYKKKYGLKNKLVAIFGGNIGLPQELEFLLELTREYKNRDDIVFLILGEGTEKGKMINIIKNEKLSNVVIKDNIKRDDYQNLIKQCDIGLINLNRNFTIPNMPSKVIGYFEASIPILASTDKNTDLREFLQKINAGLWSETGDLEGYKSNFEKLLNDEKLREELGKNGRKFLEENLSVEKTYQIISKHFE